MFKRILARYILRTVGKVFDIDRKMFLMLICVYEDSKSFAISGCASFSFSLTLNEKSSSKMEPMWQDALIMLVMVSS